MPHKTLQPHTPGPWRVDPARPTNVIGPRRDVRGRVYPAAPGNIVAFVARDGFASDRPEAGTDLADARLIAAAPELLEAARRSALDTCRADPLNPCFDGRPGDVPGRHWGGGDACAPCTARAAIAKAAGR